MFEHAADFAILALGQCHFQPAVTSGSTFEIGVNFAVFHAFDFNAVDKLLQLFLRNVPEAACTVSAFDAGRGQFHLALELAVVCHEKQPLGVQIEPPDWHQPWQVFWQNIVNRLAPAEVAFSSEAAFGFVKQV